ncbi:MAG: DUF1572 domain-containing protein, partial [Planctomycetota bacterium]|nr:DUF1572 domain-containing protein [Planctomycetota bacterium]
LDPDDLWWRPHELANSVGNLLLHLEGNIRQWILCGLGGEPDTRARSAEFRARDSRTAPELLDALGATIEAAADIVAALDPDSLGDPYEMQGIPGTVLGAIYHVVEHLSWHTGQIVWIAKERGGAGHGIAFYDDSKL